MGRWLVVVSEELYCILNVCGLLAFFWAQVGKIMAGFPCLFDVYWACLYGSGKVVLCISV
jgi:hypothetical protein